MMTSIKAIVFDYGGTLNKQSHGAYEQISKAFGVSIGEAGERSREHFHALQRGEMTEAQFLHNLFRSFGHRNPKLSVDDVLGHWPDIAKPDDEMLSLVKRVKNLGFKTPMLSNTITSHVEHNKSMGYYSLFSPVILSCMVGMRKPEPRIYELALKKIGEKPSTCVFIDDNEKYVVPASDIGMNTILFKSPGQLGKELRALGIHI